MNLLQQTLTAQLEADMLDWQSDALEDVLQRQAANNAALDSVVTKKMSVEAELNKIRNQVKPKLGKETPTSLLETEATWAKEVKVLEAQIRRLEQRDLNTRLRKLAKWKSQAPSLPTDEFALHDFQELFTGGDSNFDPSRIPSVLNDAFRQYGKKNSEILKLVSRNTRERDYASPMVRKADYATASFARRMQLNLENDFVLEASAITNEDLRNHFEAVFDPDVTCTEPPNAPTDSLLRPILSTFLLQPTKDRTTFRFTYTDRDELAVMISLHVQVLRVQAKQIEASFYSAQQQVTDRDRKDGIALCRGEAGSQRDNAYVPVVAL